MISLIKKYPKEIFIGMMVWFAVGFLFGAMNTASERDAGEYVKNDSGGMKFVSANKTGCVYKSLASLLNPGYVVGCEIFRKRFEYDGIEQVGQ